MRLHKMPLLQCLTQNIAIKLNSGLPAVRQGRCNAGLNDGKGFTLIEAVAVIVVLSILGLFTFSFVEYAVRAYFIGSKERMIYQEASYIMERITKELRDMANPTNWTNYTTYDLRFTKQHGTPQDENTNIVYWRDSDTGILYRQTRSTAQPIGQSVTRFEITRSSTSICDRSVSVQLILSDAGQSFSLISRVTPKNLGSDNFVGRCFNGDYEDIIQ